jgi:hypothetical protein
MSDENRPSIFYTNSSPKSTAEDGRDSIEAGNCTTTNTKPKIEFRLNEIKEDDSNITCASSEGGCDNECFEDNPANAPSFGGHEIVLEIVDLEKEAEEEIYTIRLLSRRAMHLPNMNWWQDWLQYIKNNHPFIGLFFHHKKHPLRVGHRLYILLSSVAFGLAATNCVYLYYANHDEEMDKTLVNIALDGHALNFKKIEALEVTYGMIALWTFGGALHTVFDICMWYLSACACFISGASCSRRGRYQLIGGYIVIALSAILSALALFVVLMRAAYDRRLRLAEEGIVLEEFEWNELGRVRNFSFLIGYGVELSLVYFVWYPMMVTALFLGLLPCLGRTREIDKQYRERKVRETKYRVHDETTIYV